MGNDKFPGCFCWPVLLLMVSGCSGFAFVPNSKLDALKKAGEVEAVRHGWKGKDGTVLMAREKRLIHATVKFQDRQGSWHMFLYRNGRPINERDAGEVTDDDGKDEEKYGDSEPYSAMPPDEFKRVVKDALNGDAAAIATIRQHLSDLPDEKVVLVGLWLVQEANEFPETDPSKCNVEP